MSPWLGDSFSFHQSKSHTNFKKYSKFSFSVWGRGHQGQPCHSSHVDAWGQLSGVVFSASSCGMQAPSAPKPFPWPITFFQYISSDSWIPTYDKTVLLIVVSVMPQEWHTVFKKRNFPGIWLSSRQIRKEKLSFPKKSILKALIN